MSCRFFLMTLLCLIGFCSIGCANQPETIEELQYELITANRENLFLHLEIAVLEFTDDNHQILTNFAELFDQAERNHFSWLYDETFEVSETDSCVLVAAPYNSSLAVSVVKILVNVMPYHTHYTLRLWRDSDMDNYFYTEYRFYGPLGTNNN